MQGSHEFIAELKKLIIKTVGISGVSHFTVEVESDVRAGLFKFDIIGLADKSIEESKLRILSAVRNSSLTQKKGLNQKIVILLCPAHIKKEGTHFDLAIAISYLQSLHIIKNPCTDWIFFGELGLKGDIRKVSNIATLILKAKALGFSNFVIPATDLEKARCIPNTNLLPVKDLEEVVNFLNAKNIPGEKIFDTNTFIQENRLQSHNPRKTYLFDSIQDQPVAKRALEISLCGKHHILFLGPPGVGKSLLANSSKEIYKEVHICEQGVFDESTFRSPHHTISHTQLVGNRNTLGEVHLAQDGVLFLDEISEFNRRCIESLREPLESSNLNNVGKNEHTTADFLLIATSNLCKCGLLESTVGSCTCTALQVRNYRGRLSGPILDRIDLCVYLRDTKGNQTTKQRHTPEKTGSEVVQSILSVRNIQNKRLQLLHTDTNKNLESKKTNLLYISKEISGSYISGSHELVGTFVRQFKISKRKESSVIRIARTIADIEKSEEITKEHLLEALSYIPKN